MPIAVFLGLISEKIAAAAAAAATAKKNFDSIKMFLISNEEKSISFKKKI